MGRQVIRIPKHAARVIEANPAWRAAKILGVSSATIYRKWAPELGVKTGGFERIRKQNRGWNVRAAKMVLKAQKLTPVARKLGISRQALAYKVSRYVHCVRAWDWKDGQP